MTGIVCYVFNYFRDSEITIIVISFILLLIVFVLIVQVFLSSKYFTKGEGLSPLESGYERLISSISVRAPFFFLAVLFVLFDLELILLFPGVIYCYIEMTSFLCWLFINVVVLVTLLVEWVFCGLKWQI